MLFMQQVFYTLLVSLAFATLGHTITTSTGSTTTAIATSAVASTSTISTTSTGITTHTIQVGPKSSPHAYVPHNITANPGDVVVFEFYPTNHSVVKADYQAPCVPASEGLFYSGMFTTFDENSDGQLIGAAPTWSLVINDTEPTFFYCTAIGSCLDNGMVGVINPNSSETWETQYQRALTYPYMLVPGQSAPAEGSSSTSSTGSSSTESSSSDSSTTSSVTSSSGGGHSGLSTGAIAGIAVACVVFVATLIALFFVLGRNRVYSQWMSSQDGRTERTARWAMFNGGGDTYQKNELDSNATKRATTDVASVGSPGSPDPNMRTFSPASDTVSGYGGTSSRHDSGQFNWDISQNSRATRGPTELEGSGIYQLPETREYR
ncbi:hypothetical protein N7462_000973 [Penicillium macrosclerotiorum]|uniref:uncharacterized protein n=1 Tax=Penicillium macrosclerotiorum TaxID=303699 RepID=UPI0025492312|nr:uncharacterized protein N7462_000973 [Penicillium macrosclerotiorum]KAJ5698968.1 hypothetical protein N7462_000973 [Penicillium macrosclerotiorum]